MAMKATYLLPVMPLTTGERLNGIQEVSGSNPLSSTDLKAFSRLERGFFVLAHSNLISKNISISSVKCYLYATQK